MRSNFYFPISVVGDEEEMGALYSEREWAECCQQNGKKKNGRRKKKKKLRTTLRLP